MTEPKRPTFVRDLIEGVLVAFGLIVVIVALTWATGGRAAVSDYFSYPQGGVWSNEIATAILAVPVARAFIRKLERHHREQKALAVKHHAERMAQAAVHHEALKAHITAASKGN